MPLIGFIRFFAALASLALLAAGAYLAWSWTQGAWVREADGELAHVREDWRLWAATALLAWSFFGRWAMLLALARPDGRSARADGRRALRVGREQRGANGQMVGGPSGSLLHVETHGPADAPPIIFTHGWGMDRTMWRYAKAELGDRFRLILWDLPGLGRSRAAPHGRIALEDFAADLAALTLMTEGPRPVLVGHSIGGMTIQTLVRDRPQTLERVAGLVLLNTTYTNPLKTAVLSGLFQALRRPVLEPAMRMMILLQPLVWLSQWQSYLSGHAHLAHRFGFGVSVTRSQLDQSALLATRNSPAVQMRGNLAMFRWDASQAMRAARTPVLVIGGEMDILTKPAAGEAISRDCPQGRWQVIEGANHMGPLERAELYNRLIGEFVLSVQPSGRLDERSFLNREDGEAPAEDLAEPPAEGPRAPPPMA